MGSLNLYRARAMSNIFKTGKSLINSGRREEALSHYKLVREQSLLLPEVLRKQIDFNIELLSRKTSEYSVAKGEKKTVVGIIAPNKPNGGLYRDAETIDWALSDNPGLSCSLLLVEDNIYSVDYSKDSLKKHSVIRPPVINGVIRELTIENWLAEIDVLIILEALNLSLIDITRRINRVKQILFMPNLEWAVIDDCSENTRPWKTALQQAGATIVTLARSQSIFNRLTSMGIHSVLLPWSIPDPVISKKRVPFSGNRDLNILFNGGNLGYRNRRGLDIVVSAMKLIDEQKHKINFFIKSNLNNEDLESLRNIKNINIVINTDFMKDRNELLAIYDQADIVLYPSRFDGFGLSLLEALHRGCYVLATDGEPMSDLVPPHFLSISSKHAGMVRLAQAYEPSPESIVNNINTILENPDLLAWNNEEYKIRQQNFCRTFSALIRTLNR